jgi:putative toxin-antitoxin system antitoxin component (TIGR02293 family)
MQHFITREVSGMVVTFDDYEELKEKVTSSEEGGLKAHQDILEGFPWSIAEDAKEVLGINDEELADILGKSERTIADYRKDEKPLTPEMSDRLFRAIVIFVKAVRYFEDIESASEWIREEQTALNTLSVIDVLQTEAGAREAEKILDRLEYGVVQ